MEHYVVTFKYGNYTMAAYSRLTSMNIKDINLISVPFSIKTECNLCIITSSYNTLINILRECENKYPVDHVYISVKVNGSYVYKMLPSSVK